MRHRARQLFDIGVHAAQPGPALAAAFAGAPPPAGPLHLLAVGKAACGMAAEALRHLAVPPVSAIAVTNAGNAVPVPGVRVLTAGHPVPDAAGLAAAQAVEAQLAAVQPGEAVLALISGGGSALLPAPVPGVSLEDKAEVNRLMLAAGLDITEMNLVRQNLSRLKGGGMLRAAPQARFATYVLSDVIGDDLRVVASGPTVAPIGTRAQAMAALTRAAVWQAVPASVKAHLSAAETPPAPLRPGRILLIGSNRMSLAAMAAASPGARIVSDRVTGAVTRAAERIIASARRAKPGAVLLFGGETTVRVTGDGLGGRNQELALRVALLGRDLPFEWVFLSGGTDGRDGPTDAAGGLVDHSSARRMRSLGIDAFQTLARSDSYNALKSVGDLLVTGATGTNVADLQIFLRA
jgi:hydroxypyruvate reductase